MRTRLKPASSRTDPGGRWVWFAPLGVFMVVTVAVGLRLLDYALGGVIALIVILLVARRPDVGLLGLIIFLPFQQVTFAVLYKLGLSNQVVRQMGSWKEILGIGVVVAGIRGFRAARKKADLLDLLALAFIGLALAYAMFPQLFADGAPGASNVRSLAFRQTAGFVLLLLGARHANLPAEFGRKAAKAIMVVGGIVASIGVVEFFFSDWWNDFVINTLEVPRYNYEVLNVGIPFPEDIRLYGYVGDEKFTRVGSLLLNALTLGFYLLLPFAFAVERTVRNGLRSSAGALLALTGAALIFTQTRAAIVGALVITLVALRPAKGKTTDRRIQYGFVLTGIILLALPVAVASGLAARSTSAAAGEDQSSIDHWDAQVDGVNALVDNPLGTGLGTSAGVGQRFIQQGQEVRITEDYYLQVGIELGVVGMLLFIALTFVVIKRLGWANRLVSDVALGAVRLAVIGLAIGAALLHTWTDFSTAWTAWALAGAVIGYAERELREESRAIDAETSGSELAPVGA